MVVGNNYSFKLLMLHFLSSIRCTNTFARVVYLKHCRTLQLLFHSTGLSDSQHAWKKRTGWSIANNWTASHWWASNWILGDKKKYFSTQASFPKNIVSWTVAMFYESHFFFSTRCTTEHLTAWAAGFLHIKAADSLKPFLHACNVLCFRKAAFWPLIKLLKAALWRGERLLPPLGSHDTARESNLSGLAQRDSQTEELRQLRKSPLIQWEALGDEQKQGSRSHVSGSDSIP